MPIQLHHRAVAFRAMQAPKAVNTATAPGRVPIRGVRPAAHMANRHRLQPTPPQRPSRVCLCTPSTTQDRQASRRPLPHAPTTIIHPRCRLPALQRPLANWKSPLRFSRLAVHLLLRLCRALSSEILLPIITNSNTSIMRILCKSAGPPSETLSANKGITNQFSKKKENLIDSFSCSLSLHPSSRLDSRWVTIFGFPRDATTYVIKEFQSYGEIVEQVVSDQGNWMHVKYAYALQAQQALGKTGKVFAGGTLMLGVAPCIDIGVMEGVRDADTVSRSTVRLDDTHMSSPPASSGVPPQSLPRPRATPRALRSAYANANRYCWRLFRSFSLPITFVCHFLSRFFSSLSLSHSIALFISLPLCFFPFSFSNTLIHV